MAIRKLKRSKKTARRAVSRAKKTAARKRPRRAKQPLNGKHRRTVKKVARKSRDASKLELIEVHDSPIHGRGVYARADIKKGRRILEYVGDRISHREADRRFFEKPDDDGHTFLFIVDGRTVIDGGTGGNPSRFVNHSCDPNCETVIQDRRVFVETIRDIKAGEELGYDYQLTWESTDDAEDLALYTCRCGAKNCRGTMLDREPVDKKKG